MSGIAGFEPEWLTTSRRIRARHADRLAGLTGRRLTRSAVVRFAENGEWYAECPVILDFGGDQVEICHQKFDELSITYNTIGCAAPILGWEDSELSPVWHFNDSRLLPFHGRVLDRVTWLEWRVPGDIATGMVAVEFGFGDHGFIVGNGLDENTIEIGERPSGYVLSQ